MLDVVNASADPGNWISPVENVVGTVKSDVRLPKCDNPEKSGLWDCNSKPLLGL